MVSDVVLVLWCLVCLEIGVTSPEEVSGYLTETLCYCVLLWWKNSYVIYVIKPRSKDVCSGQL